MSRTPKQPNHIKDAAALAATADRLQAKVDDYWNASVERYMPRLNSRMRAALESDHVSEQDKIHCAQAMDHVRTALSALRRAADSLTDLSPEFNPNPPRVRLSLEDAEFCVPKPDKAEFYADLIDLSQPIKVLALRVMGKKKNLHVSFQDVDGSTQTGFVTPSHFQAVTQDAKEDAA
jgi:hypothetical protein